MTQSSRRRLAVLAILALVLLPSAASADTRPPEPGKDPKPAPSEPIGCQVCGLSWQVNPQTGNWMMVEDCQPASVTTPEPKGVHCEVVDGDCETRELCYFV